jgi:hypothetical protein
MIGNSKKIFRIFIRFEEEKFFCDMESRPRTFDFLNRLISTMWPTIMNLINKEKIKLIKN